MSDLITVDCNALVIGGGITGCFIALRLAQECLKICLADKGPFFSGWASTFAWSRFGSAVKTA